MLRSVIICPDQKLSVALREVLAEARGVGVVRSLDHYPNHMDMVRLLRAAAPEVVFLATESRREAFALAEQVEVQQPGTQVIAVGGNSDPAMLLDVMRAGIREFLGAPFELTAVREALLRVEQVVKRKPPKIESTDSVYAFLPSKAGCGATTLAVNTSLALSEVSDSKVLLADFDLNCGMAGFMLQIKAQHSIISAAEHALEMDEVQWENIVTHHGKLDVLPSGRLAPGFRMEPTQVHHLLDFARRNYKTICLDLSGMMEKYSMEVMQESKRIFMVCTPEVPSLHLARERLVYLRSLDLGDRIAILLNRAHKRTQIPQDEVERLLGLPVFMSFPNDYEGVHQAITAGKGVKSSSELGKKFRLLAGSMAVPELVAA